MNVKKVGETTTTSYSKRTENTETDTLLGKINEIKQILHEAKTEYTKEKMQATHIKDLSEASSEIRKTKEKFEEHK
ncbi:MAG: hypothetical protein Tsb0015_00590 [Simkaniaceae bacterium]